MTASDVIQIVLMGLLVVVTGIYAWRTFAISNATKKQADASVKMAEEMSLQRLAAKPAVIPDIDIHFEQKDYTDRMRSIAESDFPVVLTNVGTAAAVELELFLKTPRNEFVSTKLPLLLRDGIWKSTLTYVYEFTEEGEPIFSQPPPEGLYELKVVFRSATFEPNQPFSEFILPFDLHWSGKDFWWKIERHKLCQKLSE